MSKNNEQDNFLKEFFEDKEISQKYSIQTDPSLAMECVKDWMQRKTALEEIFPSENYMESPHPLYEKEYLIGIENPIENISEGLIRTYPITPIIQELSKMTGLPQSRITTIKKDTDSDIPEMVKILIFDSEETVERYQIIRQIMQKGGYYFDKKDSFVIRGYKGNTLYFRPITTAFNSMASRFVSVAYHRGETEKARRYWSSVYVTNMVLIAILLPLAALVTVKLDRIIVISNVDIPDVKTLFACVFANFFIGLVSTLYSISMYVKNAVFYSNLLNCVKTICNAVLLLVVFSCLPARLFYVSSTAAVLSLAMLPVYAHFQKRLLPEITFTSGWI